MSSILRKPSPLLFDSEALIHDSLWQIELWCYSKPKLHIITYCRSFINHGKCGFFLFIFFLCSLYYTLLSSESDDYDIQFISFQLHSLHVE